MNELLNLISDPKVVIILFLYLTKRITAKQFEAEQKKARGLIAIWEAKDDAAQNVVKPITACIKLLNYVPGINIKIPFVNKSAPDLVSSVLEGGAGILGNVLHNIPFIGTNINKR
jgi:hypothetical protein